MWLFGKRVQYNDHYVFHGTILAFFWTDWDKIQKDLWILVMTS
jgi:hypothetical protein